MANTRAADSTLGARSSGDTAPGLPPCPDPLHTPQRVEGVGCDCDPQRGALELSQGSGMCCGDQGRLLGRGDIQEKTPDRHARR